MADELGTPEESSPTHIMEDILGELELQGSDLAIPPPEAGEEVGTNEAMVEEVPTYRGLSRRARGN